MSANPLTGNIIGECPACSECATFVEVRTPDGETYREYFAAPTVQFPTFSFEPLEPFVHPDRWRRENDYVAFGDFPRGSYFVQYCGGAWPYGSNQAEVYRWTSGNVLVRFVAAVGELQTASVVVPGQFDPVPALETVPKYVPQSADPMDPNGVGVIDWMDSPSVPYVIDPASGLPQQVNAPNKLLISTGPGLWWGGSNYDPLGLLPSRATTAQAAAAGKCQRTTFFHAGGEIGVGQGASGGVIPSLINMNGSMSSNWPAWRLFRAKPIFRIAKVHSHSAFNLAISVNNYSNGVWYCVPTATGPGISNVRVVARDVSGFGAYPLLELPPKGQAVFGLQYESANANTDYELTLGFDDRSGNTTGDYAPPTFTLQMTPIITVVSCEKSDIATVPAADGRYRMRVGVKLLNTGLGATNNCIMTFSDSENAQFQQFGEVSRTALVPLKGRDHWQGFLSSGGFNAGLSSGALVRSPYFYIPPDASQVRIAFSLQDGPVSHSSYEFVVNTGR